MYSVFFCGIIPVMNERELFEKTNGRTLSGAYCFAGSEELLKQQAVDRIVALLDPGFADLNLKRLKAPEPLLLLDALRSVPVFDALCVSIVTDYSDDEVFSGLEKLRALDTLFAAQDAITLFVRRGAARDSALVRLFREKNRFVSFDALDEDRAMRMCMRVCANRGVRLDRPEAYRLVDMVGTDAYRLQNEASKLCDYVGSGGAITDAVLKTVVTPSVEFEIFPMLNALLAGNKKAAMRMLQEALRDRNENALGIASFLEGRLKSMLIAKELLEEKRPRAEVLKSIGGSPKAAEMTLKNAQKFSVERLRFAVAAFAEINANLKKGLTDEENGLILAICQSF